MKKFVYLSLILLLLCGICACNKNDSNNESNGEVILENSGNFSTEMIIEDSTDVIIVEMP